MFLACRARYLADLGLVLAFFEKLKILFFTHVNTEFKFLCILFGKFKHTRTNWKHVSTVICLKIVISEKKLPKNGKFFDFLLFLPVIYPPKKPFES